MFTKKVNAYFCNKKRFHTSLKISYVIYNYKSDINLIYTIVLLKLNY